MIELFGLELQLVWFHLATLFLTVVVILIADHEGLSWMRGKKEVLEVRKISKLHRFMWIGLSLMIVTGFVMFWPLREYLLYHLPFQVKMGFVTVLFINGLFIGRYSHVATQKRFNELSKKEKFPLFISGMVSFLGWVGAIVAAILMNI